jgi:hydrogenase/urease accessory protein HupE
LRVPAPAASIELAPPQGCTLTSADEGMTLDCPGGLRGKAIEVRGMGPIISETSVVIELADRTTISHLLTSSSPRFTIPDRDTTLACVLQYAKLGVAHIASGIDHLCFLLGLVLVVRRLRAVLIAETAFTLSHTISLGATALGWIRVSPAAAEACIALSLVLVALDIGMKKRPSGLSAAALAFVFGSVHGLGFAGGLREVGLPENAIVPALAGFAGGIEVGQLAFLACALAVLHLAKGWRSKIDLAAAYAIGGVGCFWLIQRLALFIRG